MRSANKGHFRVITFMIATLGLLPFFGCPMTSSLPGMKKRVDAQTTTTTTTTTTSSAFSELHNFAITNCSECHGINRSPLFAVSDSTSAKNALDSSGIVDFSSSSNSRLLSKVQDSHCAHGGTNHCDGGDLTSWTNLLSDYVNEHNAN